MMTEESFGELFAEDDSDLVDEVKVSQLDSLTGSDYASHQFGFLEPLEPRVCGLREMCSCPSNFHTVASRHVGSYCACLEWWMWGDMLIDVAKCVLLLKV
jgi:hypothetical protein